MDELSATIYVDLFIYTVNVISNRMAGYKKSIRNFTIALAQQDQLDDFPFSFCNRILPLPNPLSQLSSPTYYNTGAAPIKAEKKQHCLKKNKHITS